MTTIQLSDTLHQQLAAEAALRGQTVDRFSEEILRGALQSLSDARPTSLAMALLEARAQIEKEGIPLLDSWSALEAEISDRRGGEYESTT